MKRKILISIFSLFLIFSLTGCNIKFIEKAPPKEKTEESKDLGNVKENPDDSEHMSLSSKKQSSELPEIKSKETKTEEKVKLGENQQEANGVIFDMQTKEVYAKVNTKLYSNAKLTGTAATGVSQGSKLTLYGISTDKKIAMVKIASSSIYYVAFEYLSDKPVDYSTETKKSEENSETKSTENKAPESNTPELPATPQPPAPTPSPPVQEQPQGGISYPSSPESTSVNFGVTFADEIFTATVVNSTTMNSGPGKILNSTGYTVIESFEAGTTVNCTGIGSNGYIRVELASGAVGFILNTDLIR